LRKGGKKKERLADGWPGPLTEGQRSRNFKGGGKGIRAHFSHRGREKRRHRPAAPRPCRKGQKELNDLRSREGKYKFRRHGCPSTRGKKERIKEKKSVSSLIIHAKEKGREMVVCLILSACRSQPKEKTSGPEKKKEEEDLLKQQANGKKKKNFLGATMAQQPVHEKKNTMEKGGRHTTSYPIHCKGRKGKEIEADRTIGNFEQSEMGKRRRIVFQVLAHHGGG